MPAKTGQKLCKIAEMIGLKLSANDKSLFPFFLKFCSLD